MSADHPRHFGSCALGAQRATRTDCLVGSVFPDPLAADVTPPAQPLTCRTDIGIAGRLILKTLRTENTFPFAAFVLGITQMGHHALSVTGDKVLRRPVFVICHYRLELAVRVLLVLLHQGTQFLVLRDADRKSTRLNSSHGYISYAVFCLKKKKKKK